MFLGPRGEGHSEKNLGETGPGTLHIGNRTGENPEFFAGIPRFLSKWLGVFNQNLDPASSDGIDFVENSQQVLSGLNVLFRNLRTHVGMNKNRTILGQLGDETVGFRTQRMKTLGRHVQAEDAGSAEDGADADADGDQCHGANQIVQPHGIAVRFSRPVPFFHQKNVDVDGQSRHQEKIKHSGEADHPTGEVLKVTKNAQGRQKFSQPHGNGGNGIDKDEERAKNASQDKGDGGVGRHKGAQHSYRDQRGAEQPVAHVVAEHEPEIR